MLTNEEMIDLLALLMQKPTGITLEQIDQWDEMYSKIVGELDRRIDNSLTG